MVESVCLQVIQFRKTPIFSFQFASAIFAGAMTGSYFSSLRDADMSAGHLLQSFLTIALVMFVLLTARNLYLKHRYGQRRISFFSDHIMLPAHLPFGDDIWVNYDEIRSLTIKTWLGFKFLELKLEHHRFQFPMSAFDGPDAPERFQEILSKRIGAPSK